MQRVSIVSAGREPKQANSNSNRAATGNGCQCYSFAWDSSVKLLEMEIMWLRYAECGNT